MKIGKKDKNSTKISNALLWVHQNIEFIKKYNTTIYEFEKVGFIVSVFPYFIILVYVAIAFYLFKQFSYFGFCIYLIPIISNIFSFLKNEYDILDN